MAYPAQSPRRAVASQLSLGVADTSHDAIAQAYRSQVGGQAEKFVDDLHTACALAGVAEVHRVRSRIQITRNLGKGRVEALLLGKSVVDCMGWSLRGPLRSIAIEVKHVDVAPALKSGAPAAWRLPLDRVEEHQAGMLERLDRAGHLALVLVVHGGQAYPVPWRVVAQARASGAASLSQEALKPWRHRGPQPYLSRFLQG